MSVSCLTDGDGQCPSLPCAAGERRRTGLLVADRLAAWFTANSGEAGFEETSSGGGAFRAEHHFTAGMNKKGH